MKSIYFIISFVAIIALAACSQEAPKTLEGKQKQLQAKKKELLQLNQEITALQEEIAELDPSLKQQIKKVPVATSTVEPETFKHFVKVQGKVEANKNIMVSPQMGGTITRIFVREGQLVRRGQILAQIDDAVMKSTIEEVKTSLELAEIVFEKQKRLWDQEIGTEIQYLTAKNQKESLERRMATLDEQLELTKIKAPISGSVDEIAPKTGEMVSPGYPAFRIVNNSDLSLVADLSESYIPYVKRGDLVRIHFPALNNSVEAKVSVVGQSIHPNDRTFNVEVRLPNNAMYKPNMFGEISINDRTRENAVTVPLSVIQQSEVGPYVFVAEQESTDKWIARRRNIKTDLSYEGKLEVVDGLKAGEKLVTAGYKDLSDGQEIVFEANIADNN